jgi:two-component system response regulator AlgR
MVPAVHAAAAAGERSVRVLIIDDSIYFRRAAKTLFEMMPRVGFVATAPSGDAGLALARSSAFDLVILDLSMEGLNGLEVARRLRILPDAPKIVMVTLHDVADYHLAATDAGVSEFMHKPALAGQVEPLLERMFGEAA